MKSLSLLFLPKFKEEHTNENVHEQKQALYAFGCPNREATVERLRYVAALAPDLETKKLFYTLAVKLSDEDCDRWYRCFLNSIRREVIRSRQQSSPGSYSAPIVEGLCE